MQKQAFKIMGALLVLVLAVSFSVGAVSAYEIPASNIQNIDIVDNSIVLTKDVPGWVYNPTTGEWEEPPASAFGNFVSAETAYGALRTAYGDYNVPYTATIDFSTGEYTISSLDGTAATGDYAWTAFVNGVYTDNLMDAISNNTEVAFLLTNDVENEYYSQIAPESVTGAIAFKVTLKEVHSIYDSTHVGNGMTGQALLEALNGTAFTVSISEPTPEYDYAWLNNVNGIYKDWTKTGYGFAVLLKKNGESTFSATEALNKFTLGSGDELRIWMAPSTLGGTWTGHTATAGYYLDAATDTVTIHIA